MTVCTANFETGIAGNTISAADAGSATAWSSVTIGASSEAKYLADPARNSLSGQVYTPTGTAVKISWTVGALGTLSDHYGRMYLYIHGTLPAITEFFDSYKDVESVGVYFLIGSAGGGAIQDASFTDKLVIPSGTFPTNQWFRVEYHIFCSATVGQATIRVYKTPDSTTFDYEGATAANINTGSVNNGHQYGQTTGGHIVRIDFDDIAAGLTDWPGPSVATTPQVMLPMGMLGTGRV